MEPRNRKKILAKIFVWVGILAINATLFTIYYFLHSTPILARLAEDFFICGMVTLLLGALYLLAYYGAFDLFYFGFRSVFSHMNPHYDPSAHQDYAEYLASRSERRHLTRPYFWPFLGEGIAFLLASGILAFFAFVIVS